MKQSKLSLPLLIKVKVIEINHGKVAEFVGLII